MDLAARLTKAAAALETLIGASPDARQRMRLKGKREGVQLAQSYLEEMLREWVQGIELTCDDCQHPYDVWFADNEVWNLVLGGPEAKGDPGGMLCPRCFTIRAEAVYEISIWHLRLDRSRVKDFGSADA